MKTSNYKWMDIEKMKKKINNLKEINYSLDEELNNLEEQIREHKKNEIKRNNNKIKELNELKEMKELLELTDI